MRARTAAIDSLKKQFTFKRDSIYDGGYYEPRGQSGAGTDLLCFVSDRGVLDFRSVYVGDDWIFHEQVVARIGDRVVETATVPTYDKDNYNNTIGGGVFESITFLDNRDGGLPRAIAESEGEVINIRLVGRQRTHDFKLSTRAQNRIRDCVRFSSRLRGE
jgi:hypothetical protein